VVLKLCGHILFIPILVPFALPVMLLIIFILSELVFILFVTSSPLVAGTSESDQLDRIFRLLGTPTPQVYPDIVNLPEFSPDLPQYPPPRGNIASLVPKLDPQGVNLLEQMLQYDPGRRISAQRALEHPFFAGINAAPGGHHSGGGHAMATT